MVRASTVYLELGYFNLIESKPAITITAYKWKWSLDRSDAPRRYYCII